LAGAEQLQQQQQQPGQQQLGQSSAAAAADLAPVLAQQQQQQSESSLHATASESDAGSALTQHDGRATYMNGSSSRLLPQQSVSEEQWKAALVAAEADASLGSYIGAWAVHIVAVVGLLLLCWVLSEAVALVLLPKLLNSQQLAYWCPNRPRAPFNIAGEVYDYVE
jgi:uncharacterized iron-regulated membrane protein